MAPIDSAGGPPPGRAGSLIDPAAGEEDGPPIDPLADLLFTLIAAVLPAIFLLAPQIGAPTLSEAKLVGAAVPVGPAVVASDGRPVVPIVAGVDGLRLVTDAGRRVGLDAIATDAGLRGLLARARAAGDPLLVIVEPDGSDAVFLLDPLLAAQGIADVREVRATEDCAATRDAALARACGARR